MEKAKFAGMPTLKIAIMKNRTKTPKPVTCARKIM
jgi:hypothetical protein